MVDVASMSDAELRTKLLEFGFPVMPITGTTRKVMEKKLKILMENKKKANAENRRSLAKYSSEEESDVDIKTSKKEKNKRATMAAPTSRVTLRKSTKRIEIDPDIGVKPSVIEEKQTMTRTTKTTIENEFDTGSDSESEIIEQTSRSMVNNHDYKSPLSSVTSSSYVDTTRKYSPPKYAEDVISKPISTSYGVDRSPGRYTSYGSNASDYAADRLNQIRSRLSLGTSTYDRPLYSPPTSPMSKIAAIEKDEDQAETPFLSNFTKRLSQLSNNSRFDDYKNDVIKEHDTNGSSGVEIKTYMSRPYRHTFQRDYQSAKRTNAKNNLVSFAVIALAFLFFIIIAIAYMGLHSGQTSLIDSTSDLIVNRCEQSAHYKPNTNCVFTTQLRDAVKMYEIIKSELVRRAIDHHCVNSNIKPSMTEKEVLQYVSVHSANEDLPDLGQSLRDTELLSLSNPRWEVALIKVVNGAAVGNAIKGFDELYDARESAEIALTVLNPGLPWTCSLYNKIAAMVQTSVLLAVAFAGVYSLNKGYKYYKHYRQKQKDELFYMVERIIDILQSNTSEDGAVINHVRDMILPINDRHRMERTWRKAVDFINKNESRIRTEIQIVQGEPYEIWRWLGSPNLSASGSPRNKSWQGQAFETQVGSVNSLPCSPTPCLKIRGMVDDGDRNLHTIREAVLSKCAHQCRILHCAVDTNSKCVYLKCADQNDAAIAYRSLHGWWYAGNLVTVKYLRLERYVQRYPDSPVSGPPYLKALQPATDWTS